MRLTTHRLSGTLHAALHAAAGAPRLYRAARRAGAVPVASARLLVESALVLFVVAPRAAGVPGRQNAVRHFVWQALLSARHGESVARAVADAQEDGTLDAEDSALDRHNNAVGQAYGAAHAADLASVPAPRAMRVLLRAGLAAWEAGELSGRRTGPARGRADVRRRRGSPGPATPRKRS
jgi:hypothetical protein